MKNLLSRIQAWRLRRQSAAMMRGPRKGSNVNPPAPSTRPPVPPSPPKPYHGGYPAPSLHEAASILTVPVTLGFDRSKVIGSMRIDVRQLPPAPTFVFSLAFEALEFVEPFEVRSKEYVGRYLLSGVGLVSDADYLSYLRQIRVTGEHASLPRAWGVSRDADSPGQRSVLVAFERALTDDELSALHDLLRRSGS